VALTPGTSHYRSASHTTVEQRIGEQTQRNEDVRVYYLTVSLKQGERLDATFTVDSVQRYESNGRSVFGSQAMRGATFAGQVARDGTVSLSGGDSSVRAVAEMRQELSRFFPRIPPGGVVPGARWADTTQIQSDAAGLPLTVVAVNQHEALSPQSAGTGLALPIRTVTAYTYTGNGSQGGQAYTVDGEGRRQMLELLSPGGRYLGMTSADSSTFTVSLTAMDVRLPGRQTRADTLTLLP
jgi:hypothetical protein